MNISYFTNRKDWATSKSPKMKRLTYERKDKPTCRDDNNPMVPTMATFEGQWGHEGNLKRMLIVASKPSNFVADCL